MGGVGDAAPNSLPGGPSRIVPEPPTAAPPAPLEAGRLNQNAACSPGAIAVD
jgi:hypothetical protein